MTRSDEMILRRTGGAALMLRGYGLIAQATSRAQTGTRQSRWHEIDVWADDSQIAGPAQRHAIAIRYRTQWQGELGHDYATVVERQEIARVLTTHDPLTHVAGYPPHEHYAQKQRRILSEIRAGWEHAISEVLEIAKVWEIGDAS
jgi:hypothetical protein